jgi:hypothetical protein
MITKPTVLILGAGASEHCGYPLGKGLVSRLCSLRGTHALDTLPEGLTRKDAESFLTRLSYSDSDSIDAFLEKNRDQAQLGKFLIAREIKQHENIDSLFPPNNPGWYHHLFNKLIVDEKDPHFSDQLKIVTFNYDRSLEAYLYTRLQHSPSSQIDAAKAESILKELPIIHVHGILGEFPKIPYQSQYDDSDLFKISQNIKVGHELADQDEGFCNDLFKQANKMLKDASRIFFLGFGFHLDNVRRFQFFTRDNTRETLVRSTTYPLQELELKQLVGRLTDYGFTDECFPANNSNCEYFFKRTADLE